MAGADYSFPPYVATDRL